MRTLRTLAVTAGLLTAAPLCIGAQVTTTFTATANVVRGCAIATTDMNFGTYPALATAPALSATSTIIVTCELADTYSIGLDDGSNSLGVLRRMARVLLPVAYLNYGLYKDAAHTQLWRDTGPTRVNAIGTGLPQLHTVYGQLPGAQLVAVGAYVDTVTVTVRN